VLTFYGIDEEKGSSKVFASVPETLPRNTLWIDLLNPTREDERAVERLLGVEIPTRDEMQEIEFSSRLYVEAGALVMSQPVINKSATDQPETAVVTFILTKECLATVRYAEPAPFSMFIQRLARDATLAHSCEDVLVGLLEQIADRLADILEGATSELEKISRDIFLPSGEQLQGNDFKIILSRIGHVSDLSSKAKDSLLNLNRLNLFLAAHMGEDSDLAGRIKTLSKDVHSLDEHGVFLSAKVSFLLDATLGMINIEQNNIIKIFSVAAVAFLPPTLIASIYGMNFHVLPELEWSLGYPMAIFLMLLSAIVPFRYFRAKKWL